MNKPQHILAWNHCLNMIKNIIPPTSFKTWFEPIKAVKLNDTTLTIEVPSDFFQGISRNSFH
jgi:hypothetical protein